MNALVFEFHTLANTRCLTHNRDVQLPVGPDWPENVTYAQQNQGQAHRSAKQECINPHDNLHFRLIARQKCQTVLPVQLYSYVT